MTQPARRRRSSNDDRSALAIALQWSSTITTISVGMVVPGLLGYWADSHLGTGFLFLILGMTLGVTVGIWQLVRLTQVADSQAKQRSEVSDDSNESQGTGTQK